MLKRLHIESGLNAFINNYTNAFAPLKYKTKGSLRFLHTVIYIQEIIFCLNFYD